MGRPRWLGSGVNYFRISLRNREDESREVAEVVQIPVLWVRSHQFRNTVQRILPTRTTRTTSAFRKPTGSSVPEPGDTL